MVCVLMCQMFRHWLLRLACWRPVCVVLVPCSGAAFNSAVVICRHPASQLQSIQLNWIFRHITAVSVPLQHVTRISTVGKTSSRLLRRPHVTTWTFAMMMMMTTTTTFLHRLINMLMLAMKGATFVSPTITYLYVRCVCAVVIFCKRFYVVEARSFKTAPIVRFSVKYSVFIDLRCEIFRRYFHVFEDESNSRGIIKSAWVD